MLAVRIADLPEDVEDELRARAERAGRSIENEARELLAAVVRRARADDAIERLPALIDECYGSNKPKNVVDDFIAERRREAARE